MPLTSTVDKQGRLLLPADWRKRFNVTGSTKLALRELENGALVLETPEQGIRRAQAIVAKYLKDSDRSLSEELLQERREEAARE